MSEVRTSEPLAPDICVIGGGPAGLAAAMAAAAAGRSVVLVERARLGGRNLHGGTVAAQALIATARRVQAIAEADRVGLSAARPKIDFMRVQDHIAAAVSAFAPDLRPARLAALGVRLLDGEARFADASAVHVGDTAIAARRFVVATGAAPALPAIEGLAEAAYLTTDTIFDLRVCPRRLIVLGAGAHGLALAQAYARLGAEVVVLDGAPPLPSEDSECVWPVLDAVRESGVDLRAGVAPRQVRRVRGRVQVSLENGETVEGTHLLVAGPEAPNLGALGLDAARIRFDADGILVDGDMLTSNRRVYAIGDVTRGPKSVALALRQAEIVIGHVVHGLSGKGRDTPVPRFVHTDPEIAAVGLTDAEARTRRRGVRVSRWPFAETQAGRATQERRGHVKIVTDGGGRVLGAAIVGRGAAEALTPWTLAVARGLTIGEMAQVTVPVSGPAEAGRRAAASAPASGLTPGLLQRIMRPLRRIG